jgi:hypothetical protein
MKSLLMNTENVVGLNPKHWRNRAEGARVVALSMQDEQSKQLMLGVAKEYERVGELTEKRLKRRGGKTFDDELMPWAWAAEHSTNSLAA